MQDVLRRFPFLAKSFFDTSPYLSNKYGYEELSPSLMTMDAGMINAFCPDLIAIHKPAVNKWDCTSDKNMEYLIIECGGPYAIKRKVLENNFQILLPILCRCVIGWRESNLVHL